MGNVPSTTKDQKDRNSTPQPSNQQFKQPTGNNSNKPRSNSQNQNQNTHLQPPKSGQSSQPNTPRKNSNSSTPTTSTPIDSRKNSGADTTQAPTQTPSEPSSKQTTQKDDKVNSPEGLQWAKKQFDELSMKMQEEQAREQQRSEAVLTDSIPLELDPEDIKIGEFLGEGVYSEVYKGYCYGTQVAVKKFKNQGFDPEVLKEVRKEVRIMKSIHHTNLLLFLGACTRPGYLMIVTELMDKSFHELAHIKSIDLLTRLRMAKEAAKGIAWLHSLTPAIIHRDLKPENILVGSDLKTVKVADFGLSLVKDHSSQEREEMKRIRGSPAFMSPEALLGSDLTPKTDVYSFGMIMWELLTGQSPYDSLNIESFDQLIEEICEKGTRETIPADCPPTFRKLIESCWQRLPEMRPNFLQIINQLDECILEVAISDPDGRRMWKRHFFDSNSLKSQVTWQAFLSAVTLTLRMNPSLKIFQGLKMMLIKNDSNMVSIEEFGNLLKWFGPMMVANENENNFVFRMQNLLTKRWFHGDISLQEAQARLAGSDSGTFLIRFSSNPGQYALSKMIENSNKDHVIVHIRISHSPGSYAFVLDGQTHQFSSLDELVKSPALALTKPCGGSKYYAQFR